MAQRIAATVVQRCEVGSERVKELSPSGSGPVDWGRKQLLEQPRLIFTSVHLSFNLQSVRWESKPKTEQQKSQVFMSLL
jgi:hypothetical protein